MPIAWGFRSLIATCAALACVAALSAGPALGAPRLAPSVGGSERSFHGGEATPDRSHPLPPVVEPTAAHPLVLLKIGDSLGEELGFGLRDLLSNVQHVTIVQEAVGDSGLARPDFYNWPVHLRTELSTYHPNAVIVMLGGDDGQNFVNNGRIVQFGTALWHTAYAQRVATMMSEALASGAHVIWVGLPIMQSSQFSGEMELMNSIYASEAAMHPGVTFVPTWRLFSNSTGQYSAYLPGPDGKPELMRNSDGVHFAGAGEDRLAAAVIQAMNSAWETHL